ncbi:MAG: hypothetical protein CVV56_00360 [Tenericutes bacterium HGW-Tenericutes-1]|nr:MAG: hypothetical protein CVV56_00360 [Tenericutes bacterium HGW-Tenericutes-1]
MKCDTKYPIFMIHGIGFRDNKYFNYWGRTPKVLIEEGSLIRYGSQDSWGSIEENALTIKERILFVIKETSAKKVNIIAHSKGGIDARYMISSLDMSQYVASLTTIQSPHHGSKVLDIISKFPKFIIKIVSFFVNLWFRLLGDKSPDFYSTVSSLTTKNMAHFNEINQDSENVYYQSYGFKMKNMFSDIFLMFPYLVTKLFEGDNDGIVSVKSSKWTNFKGPYSGKGLRGISHLDEVDFRRTSIKTKKQNDGINDIPKFYLELVNQLKDKGY